MPRVLQEELEQACLAIVNDNPEALAREVCNLYIRQVPKSLT